MKGRNMSFVVANKPPIVITVDGKPIPIPRARRKFWIDWAAAVNAEKLERATKDLSADDKARWLAIYDVAHTTTDDLVRRAMTPEGQDKIIEHCMKAGNVERAVIDKVLEELGPNERAALALGLGSIIDPINAAASQANTSESNGDGEKGGSDAVDPLARNTSAVSIA